MATIREISELMPIEGKDRIELATVDGWHVIVGKGEFRVGEKCVYCEPDTQLPDAPEFEFLRKRKFRIKTIKMGGVISQGICFTMDILPAGSYILGDDVTEIIGATEYVPTMDDPPTQDISTTKRRYPKWLMRHGWFRRLVTPSDYSKRFPDFIKKTDEERIQNCPWVLQSDALWIATEKVDGTSATYAIRRQHGFHPFKPYEYYICSRNRRLPTNDGSVYWHIWKECGIAEKLESVIGINEWIAIQGEIIGPKIQGNKYGLSEPEFYMFNVIRPSGRLSYIGSSCFARQIGLKHVPIVNEFMILPDDVDSMLKLVHGKSMINSDVNRKGLVIRSRDGKQSFKAVDPLFLIGNDA